MSRPIESESLSARERSIPLCVDLDQTLIRTDILWESGVMLWRRPDVALRAAWLLATRGKAAMKQLLAQALPIDAAALPYRHEVVELVRSERDAGREAVLATATDQLVAQRISDHLGLFSRILASDGEVNLSGRHKQRALETHYGNGGFDYVGDDRKDLPIFAAARNALLVNPTVFVLRQATAVGNVTRVIRDERETAMVLVHALRLHQWAKNLLLAVPLFTAHMVLDEGAWAKLIVAFVGFGLVASATYVVNDLIDLRSDRTHPSKCLRPLASGRLAIRTGMLLAVGLGVLGFALSATLLPMEFVGYLAAYAVLTLTYSFVLKRRLLLDVLTLSGLYTLRILAGGAAIYVTVSEWLLMFSLFIFLSLAFLKRSIELSGAEGSAPISGRGYSPVDLDATRMMGIAAGLVSVLVLALYISSPAVIPLYRAPKLLWLICPLLIYWIARLWFLAARNKVHHDPVVFALLDLRSYAVGACGIAIAFLAKVGLPDIHL